MLPNAFESPRNSTGTALGDRQRSRSTELQTLNAVIFVVFLGLIVVGGLRTLLRLLEYRVIGREVPILLVRDVISRNGLALSFSFILFARAIELPPETREQLWWTLLTSLPALFGAATYAYFEFFVIDNPRFAPKRDQYIDAARRPSED